jgi:hypothetical protein
VNDSESLLDTYPGWLFTEHLRSDRPTGVSPAAFVAAMTPEDLIRAVTSAVTRYLYSDDWLDLAHFDTNHAELHELSTAGLAALSRLSTFDSPQTHQGTIRKWRTPNIRNRDGLSALPAGAFWTSTPLADREDSWTICNENLRREDTRWQVHFDATRVRVARIDSTRDWVDLIESHPVTSDGRRYPDWPAIANYWDAVHLSPTGLLLAHPAISISPVITTDRSGAHSQAGPHASVAPWCAVSTAWLHQPPSVVFRPTPATA